MKSLSLVAISALLAVACSAGDGTNPTTTTTTESLESWCADQTADRCVEGISYLDHNPGLEACVFTSEPAASLWDECGEAQPGVPVTTVPPVTTPQERLVAERAERLEMTERLARVDERAMALLQAAHPSDVVTVGLVFANPSTLAEAEQFVANGGGRLIAAWRTDYVCLPGSQEFPMVTASRFGYLDGVERAQRLQTEMDNSTTPVTGAHIARNAFAVMAQEATALLESGVTVEAVEGAFTVAMLESILEDGRVSRLRVVDFPTDWVDLSDLPIPSCG